MKRHSLLFGIQEYSGGGELTALKCPHADVDALAGIYSDARFMGEVGQVTVCKDHTLPEARQSFRQFFRNVGREDVAIIHFSGHGLRNDAGDFFLCFSDAEEDDLEMTALNVTRLREWLEAKRLRRMLITLDCCYSGAAGSQLTRDSLASQLRAVERPMSDGTGLYVLSSAGATETAKEGDGRGVFTHHLIEGIRTGAADNNGDGEITVSEIAEYLQREVPKHAARQQPEFTAHKVAGTFVVARNPVALEAERARREAELAAGRARERAGLSETVAGKLRDHENAGAISMVFAGAVQSWLDAHPLGEEHPRLALLEKYAAGRIAAVDFHDQWRDTATAEPAPKPPPPEPEPAHQPWSGPTPMQRAAARSVAAAPAGAGPGPGVREGAARFGHSRKAAATGPTPMQRAAARSVAAAPAGAGPGPGMREGAARFDHSRKAAAAEPTPGPKPSPDPPPQTRPGLLRRKWPIAVSALYGAALFFVVATENGGMLESIAAGAVAFLQMWIMLLIFGWLYRTVTRLRDAASERFLGRK